MGMFPYTCEKCGGAWRRCGQHHKKCSGGQFCWEDNVVFKVNEKIYNGVYNGYGKVISGENEFILSEFNEYIPGWGEPDYDWKNTIVICWCQSCYN